MKFTEIFHRKKRVDLYFLYFQWDITFMLVMVLGRGVVVLHITGHHQRVPFCRGQSSSDRITYAKYLSTTIGALHTLIEVCA